MYVLWNGIYEMGKMSYITGWEEDTFSDLLCRDVQCAECGGHAVQIFPRSKYNILWPAICLFCGSVGLTNTRARSQDLINYSQSRYEWGKMMTEIFAYHLNQYDDLNYFRYNLQETHIV